MSRIHTPGVSRYKPRLAARRLMMLLMRSCIMCHAIVM
jgi:hypothetical protein